MNLIDTYFLLRHLCIVVSILTLVACEQNTKSKKGSKYALLKQRNIENGIVQNADNLLTALIPSTTSPPSFVTATTEDPFFNDENDLFADFDDAFEDEFSDDLLPNCDELTDDEIESGFACSNETIFKEPRYNDPIFERLFAQLWQDYQISMNTRSSLYGRTIDPLDLHEEVGRVSTFQTGMGYKANITMHSIKMFGLSSIRLAESTVTRNMNLTDIDVKLVFAFDKLTINGSYALKGFVGWYDVDSEGEQNFEISMLNATLEFGLHLDIVSSTDEDTAITCRGKQLLSLEEGGNVVITEIRFPLKYDDVNFKFENLGDFANTVVNAAGIYFLQTQEELVVGNIRSAVKQNVNSLIC